MLKIYNWDFPEWFNPREFNSVSEFIIAYIEQVLSIRFWFALEEKKEKLAKNIPILSFSLCEEPNFNELFDNREKLILFLTGEYNQQKEKLFISSSYYSSVIDLKKLLCELKNDTNIMSKVKKPKQDSMKNYFYYLNKQTKFELFEPPIDNDHETIEKIKKFFLDETEEHFIDELIFCRLENLSKIISNYSLDTLEDYLLKKIFEVLHNIYTEKNAIDLMNEELNEKSRSENKSRQKRLKKNLNKKKVRSESSNRNSLTLPSLKNDSNDSTPVCENNEFGSEDSPCENRNTEPKNNFTSKTSYENINEVSLNNSSSNNVDTSMTINKSNHIILTVKSENEKENKTENLINNSNLNTKTHLTNKTNNCVPTIIDNSKMSWRKMPQLTCGNNNNNNNDKSKSKAPEQEKLPFNKDEIYVNDLVKNLLKKIICNEDKVNESSNIVNTGLILPKTTRVNDNEDKDEDGKLRPYSPLLTKESFSKINKSLFNNKNNKQIKKTKPISKNTNISTSNNNNNNQAYKTNTSTRSTLYNAITGKEKSSKVNSFQKEDTTTYTNVNESSLNKTKPYKKQFAQEKEKRPTQVKESKERDLMKNIKPKEFLQNENEELCAVRKNSDRSSKNLTNDANLNNMMNIQALKNYSSDNECKIVTMNHEIISNNLSIVPSPHMRSDSKKVMVDNYSQTDKKGAKVNEAAVENLNLSETVHSMTHDEDEKLNEVNEDKSSSNNNNNNNTDVLKSSLSLLLSPQSPQCNNTDNKNSTNLKTDKPQKKKKRNLYINNFKLDSENLNLRNQLNNNNIINNLNVNEGKKIFSSKASSNVTSDCHLELKKSISEGYQFGCKKDLKINSNSNISYNNNHSGSVSTTSSNKTMFNSGSINNSNIKKPIIYNSNLSNSSTPNNQNVVPEISSLNINININYASNSGSNGVNDVSKEKFNYYNYNDEGYHETDESFSSYPKSRYGYNKNYYTNSTYGKRSKYSTPTNYFGVSSNKFNNADSSYVSKNINNRTFYSRPNYEFNPYHSNTSSHSNTSNTPNPANFTLLGNYPVNADNAGGLSKESQVFNNYYIINSNVNINSVHNFNQSAEKKPEADTEETDNDKEKNKEKENEKNENEKKENDLSRANKNVNMFQAGFNNGVSCTNFGNFPIHENFIGNNVGNFVFNNKHNNMMNYPSMLFPGSSNFMPYNTPGQSFTFPNTASHLNSHHTSHSNPHLNSFNNIYYNNNNIYNNYNNNNNKSSDLSSDNPDHNLLSKIEGDIYPFIFHYKIHNDILDYSNSVTQSTTYLKEIKLYIIKMLERNIKIALGSEISINLYGSFATDLSIESSDIDITVKFAEERNEVEIEEIIDKLCLNFRSLQLFDAINPILTASVPVIKILVDPLKVLNPESEEMKQYLQFKNTDTFKNYKFEQDDLLKIKVDLTFIELNNCNKQGKCQSSTKNSLDWAKKTLASYPEIRPIIHVMKRYLQIKKLNSSFNGGLSSFSLFLLIVAYLKFPKIKTKINLGRILMEMMELYGKYFQYAQSIIDVNSVSPFVFTNDFLENFPVILDPVTGLNVAKNSFRIEEVRESLSNAYDTLNKQKILFDKKDLPNSTNVIYDLMLKNEKMYKKDV